MKKFLSILFAVIICIPVAVLASSCGKSKVLKRIIVDTSNVVTTFYVGQEFSSEGLVVKAKFEDDSVEEVDEFELSAKTFNKDVAGEYKVTVAYKDKTASYTVKVLTTSDYCQNIVDKWTEDSSWVKNIVSNEYLYMNSVHVGQTSLYLDDNIYYHLVDNLNNSKVVTDFLGEEVETWIVGKDKYNITEAASTHKQFPSFEEAVGNARSELFADKTSFMKEFMANLKKNYTDDYKYSTSTVITESEGNVKIIFDDNYVYVFNPITFKISSVQTSEIEVGNYTKDTTYYYINSTPTARMTTVPTDVQWTELN